MSDDSVAPGTLRVVPLGGLGEIGMNCMVLESQDAIVIIDCGLMFSDLDHFGIEFVIPDFTYIKDRADKVKAIVLTHGHEDHIGAVPYLLKAGVQAPIYGSSFTMLLLKEKLQEHGLLNSVPLNTFRMGQKLDLGAFKIQTTSVNHSIVDAAALIIDTPAGKIIHTGDFKIDPTPFYGSKLDENVFKQAGDEGVLLLMSDSTNVERHEHSWSEKIVYQKFEQLFAAAEGLTLVAMFASNVGRMGQVFELAKKMGKKVALSGRSMEQNVRLGMDAGYLKDAPAQLIPIDAIDDYDRRDVIVLSTGSQGEYRSALIRIANGEHKHVQLQDGDLVVMSSKFIPGNEKAIGRMINQLFKQGAEVLYESVHDIHVSGHATRPELKRMIELCRPKFFLPIHGEYRHLVHHQKVAEETGLPRDRVLVAVNGDIIQVTPKTCQVVDAIEEPRVFIEGHGGNDIPKLILKDRRQLGETGAAFCLMVRNAETRKIIAGPEVILKGIASPENEVELIEGAQKLVRQVTARYANELDAGALDMDLQESIRIELRRFFHARMGKKPVVLPIVLDL